MPKSPFLKTRTLKARDLVTGHAIHLAAVAHTARVLEETSSTKQQEQLKIKHRENLEALVEFWKPESSNILKKARI